MRIMKKEQLMASQITNYKCPACTGPLHYGVNGMMECDYCGSSYSVEEIEALYAGKDEAAEAAFSAENTADGDIQPEIEYSGFDFSVESSEWGADAGHMRAYSCPSCGAEIFCTDSTGATGCPYCGNPTVIPGQFAEDLKPDLIIPFRYDKEAAKEALNGHYKGKKLLPSVFKEDNHIDEIKGVYVPFWLYDADVDATMLYRGKSLRTWSDGRYQYTETTDIDIERAGTLSFENVPVDASSSINNTLMESIEPYDISEAVDFKTAYLTGFFANRYEETAEDCIDRAQSRMRESTRMAFDSTVSGRNAVLMRSNMRVNDGRAKYALLPVWILNTVWNDNRYIFAMNGQTGKFVGDLPVDKSLYWKNIAKIGGGLGIGLYLIQLLINML